MIFAHGSAPPEPTFPGVLLRWEPDPFVMFAVALAAALYARGVTVVSRRHPDNRVPARRQVAFYAGLAAVVVALLSPVAAYDTTLFSFHMVQHVLLTMVAAPLLLLGAPVTLALRAAPKGFRRRVLGPVLRSRVLHVLTHPLITWTLFTGVMWVSHFSSLFDLALENPVVHVLEHVLYLGSALLFWWPVLGVDPGARKLSFPVRGIYLFLAMPQNTFLSLAIFSAKEARYPHYASLERPWGGSALADQQLAGGIMWVAGDLLFLAALVAMMAMWARHEDRMGAIIDARLDAERGGSGGRPEVGVRRT